MERAHAGARGEVGERGRFLGRLDRRRRAAPPRPGAIGRAELVGPAALAGAEARAAPPPRRRRKERDVLALRRTRGAARPAIDAGGADGEEKFAVEVRSRRRTASQKRPRGAGGGVRRCGRLVSIMGIDIGIAPGFCSSRPSYAERRPPNSAPCSAIQWTGLSLNSCVLVAPMRPCHGRAWPSTEFGGSASMRPTTSCNTPSGKR